MVGGWRVWMLMAEGVENVDVDGRGSTDACLLFALDICEGEATDFANVYC